MNENWETKTSFLNDPNLETIADGIYVYRNFIDEKTVKEITDILYTKVGINNQGYETLIDWYADKILIDVHEMFPIWEKMSQFLYPTHVIHPRSEVAVIRPGDGGMPPHTDSPGEGNHDELTQYDVWSTCTLLDYGVIVYFGEWTGGALYYPNMGVELELNPGDLAIHGAHGKHLHGVREVESGIRFAFSNFCLPAIKNPGSFINFNTEVYKKMREKDDFLIEYHKPLIYNEREYKKIEE
jgi:hypothetical protein